MFVIIALISYPAIDNGYSCNGYKVGLSGGSSISWLSRKWQPAIESEGARAGINDTWLVISRVVLTRPVKPAWPV